MLTKLPWWSGFPMSFGMGAMGVFAPSVMPEWWQKIFFFAGAACFAWGLISAFWHFGFGAWLKSNVTWRFRLRQPAYSPPTDLAKIQEEYDAYRLGFTNADRERFSEAWRDVHDFIGGELRPFLGDLQAANTHDMIGKLPPLQERQVVLSARASALWNRHSHYLGLMKLDIAPILQTLEAMRNPFGNALKARDWPHDAQVEKTRAIAAALAAFNDAVNQVWRALPAKRNEFIDVR
jgi:hypothetical protein